MSPKYYQEHRKKLDKNTKKWQKSFFGKMSRMYSNALQRVLGQDKKRPSYKGLEICTRNDFYKFVIEKSNYMTLHSNWINSNYEFKLTPTIDRINKSKGYTLDNIEIVTLSENVKRRDKCPI